MLIEDKELPEIYYMKHRHDNDETGIKYEEIILKKSLSTLIFMNDKMNSFIVRLQKLLSLQFDRFNIIKNWKNYTVDKYYNNHNS